MQVPLIRDKPIVVWLGANEEAYFWLLPFKQLFSGYPTFWVGFKGLPFLFLGACFLGVDCSQGFDHLFFLRQEIDAVPGRALWLDQYAREALCYEAAAIRGSRYLGADGPFPGRSDDDGDGTGGGGGAGSCGVLA